MITLAICVTYALNMYVTVQIIFPGIKSKVPEKWTLFAEYILIYGLILVSFTLSAIIPELDDWISLVGSVSSSTIALIAPPILYSVTHPTSHLLSTQENVSKVVVLQIILRHTIRLHLCMCTEEVK